MCHLYVVWVATEHPTRTISATKKTTETTPPVASPALDQETLKTNREAQNHSAATTIAIEEAYGYLRIMVLPDLII